jgi:biopolymer transport protein ExbB
MVLFFSLLFSAICFSAGKIESYIPDQAGASDGMTLWQTIQSGGFVMIVLALLSVTAVTLIVFYFITIKPDNLIPEDFLERSINLIEENRFNEARDICANADNLIADVFEAGLTHMEKEKIIIKEAMEDEGRRRADNLWQRLSYLADIAAISPMVGLLGTVLGMIQAFNVIAFQTGAVKPILLASGISKAMVTTAAGLIIAIPAMIFHSFFKGRIQDVIARLENISVELYHLLTEKKG